MTTIKNPVYKSSILFSLVFVFFINIRVAAQNVAINTTGAAATATNFVEVLQPSTTASSVGIYSLHSGAIIGTGYAVYFSKTGASTTNVAGYFSATGATNNYAGIFENGNVGIGTTSPSYRLHVQANINGNFATRIENVATTNPLGLSVETGASDNSVALRTYTAGTARFMVYNNGDVYMGNGGGTVGIGTSPGTYMLSLNTPNTDATNIGGLRIDNAYSGTLVKYGIYSNVTTDGTGTKYGISNTVNGLTANASINYGIYNYNVPNGTGTAYALYNYISNVGTGIRYGMYNSIYAAVGNTSSTYGGYNYMSNSGSGNSYSLYLSNASTGSGTDYGVYSTGEDYNYYSGKTGMGTITPVATLDIQVANVTTSATTVGNVHIMANGAQAIDKGGSLTLGGYYDDAASTIRVFGSIEGRKSNGTTGSSTGYLAFKTNSSGVLSEVMRIDYDGQVGIGTTAPSADLHIFTADNGIGQIIQINATSANITTSDNFMSFRNDAGTTIGAIEGTATSGLIAYTTFTGAHYTIIDERNGLEPNMLLEATGENFDTEQEQLVKSRICSTRQSKAAYGVYGGTNNEGKDLVLSMGTGYIWVANKGQDIEVGDYLISSDIRGCAEKQDDDLSHNYSVAKAQQPIKWNPGEIKRLIACIYLGG